MITGENKQTRIFLIHHVGCLKNLVQRHHCWASHARSHLQCTCFLSRRHTRYWVTAHMNGDIRDAGVLYWCVVYSLLSAEISWCPSLISSLMKLFVRSSSISWHLSLSLKFGLSTKESLNSRVGNPMIRPEIKPHKTVQLGISSETLAHPCHHYHPYPHWNAQSVALLQRFMRKFLFTSALWTFIKPNFCSSQLEIMRLLLVTLDNTRKPAVACVMALLFTVQTLSLIR